MGSISATAPLFSGRVDFRILGWQGPQIGFGRMATSPLEAWPAATSQHGASRTLPWHTTPPNRGSFPLPLKWQRGFCAERGALTDGMRVLFLELRGGLFYFLIVRLMYFRVFSLGDVSDLITKLGKVHWAI